MLFGQLESVADLVQVWLGCGDALGRLFLEAMKDVDRIAQLDRIDSAIGVTVVVFDDLEDASRSEPLEWLCLRVLGASLGEVEGEAKDVLDVIGHGH